MPEPFSENGKGDSIEPPSELSDLRKLRLKNVTKLKLSDASRVDGTDVEIAGIEPEIVERGICHITRSRGKLWRV
jgi:hypothetical protein